MKEKKEKHFVHTPVYPGGPKALTDFIYKNLRYPKEALKLGIEGTVFLEMEIDYKGNVVDTRMLQSLGHGCDEEAARVAKLLKFSVARNRGIKVLFHKKLKIRFKVAKKIEKVTPPQQIQMQYTFVKTNKEKKKEEKPAKKKPSVVYSYKIQ